MEDGETDWRNSLKEGSLVDAVKVEPMMEVRCWARAVVIKRTEQSHGEPDKVKLTFEDDKGCYDREVSILSQDLAPREKGKAEEEMKWRNELKDGSFIDCFDST